MYLTLHISSQKVLLLCLIPPMWKLLLSMISILVIKQMVLRKISHFLSIIVHVKFQVKLRMKFHFNFQYKFHMQCVWHYTYLDNMCFYCVWLLQFERIIINDEYVSGKADGIKKISQFLSIMSTWNFKWNYDWNFTSTFNTNFFWNVSDITHIFTKGASIMFDSSNLKVLL